MSFYFLFITAAIVSNVLVLVFTHHFTLKNADKRYRSLVSRYYNLHFNFLKYKSKVDRLEAAEVKIVSRKIFYLFNMN